MYSTEERLVFPGKSTRTDKDAGYRTLATNIIAFADIGDIPLNIDIRRLDSGLGIGETFIANQACWHKSCKNKFDNQKVQRAIKRRQTQSCGASSPVKTRKEIDTRNCDNLCFFCDKSDQESNLHRVRSLSLDRNVWQYTTDLNKTKLLAKLSAGDMIAIKAVYHKQCLSLLFNQHAHMKAESNKAEKYDNCSKEGIVLGEILSFIEGSRNNMVAPSFKLSELVKMYETRLEELGVKLPQRVNSTRLKEQILSIVGRVV